MKIFHHHVGPLFPTDKVLLQRQVAFINETDKFSVLGYLNDNFLINGVFNFLFHFPDDYPEDYYYFNQSINPLITLAVANFSSRLVIKKCEFIQKPNFYLTGLGITTASDTYLDGNIHSGNYWYSVGANQYYQSKIGQIPGPPCFDEMLGVSTTDLWMRIRKFEDIRFFNNFCRFTIRNCDFSSSILYTLPLFYIQILYKS